MTTPNPLAKTKGAGTTFWMYTGKGDAFANPLGPAALKVVYDLGKKAAADFMQQQARDGGRLSGAYR